MYKKHLALFGVVWGIDGKMFSLFLCMFVHRFQLYETALQNKHETKLQRINKVPVTLYIVYIIYLISVIAPTGMQYARVLVFSFWST